MSYLHEWHMQRHNFLGPCLPPPPPPGALGRGQKVNKIIKSQSQSQFQRFLNQTLCVFSQMKDMNYIKWDFHSDAWVMPLGVRSKKFVFRNSTRFGVGVTYMNVTCNGTIFWVPISWGLREGPKGQILLNLNYKVNNYQRCLNKLCVSYPK